MCVSYIHNAIMEALPYVNSNPSRSSVALTARFSLSHWKYPNSWYVDLGVMSI